MKKKLVIGGIVLAMSVSSLTGCGLKTDTPLIGNIVGLKSDELFQTKKIICTKAEYMVEFIKVQEQLKKQMGEGLDWTATVDGQKTLETVAKEQARDSISVTYTLAALADDFEVSLTEREKDEAKESGKAEYEETDSKILQYTGATQETYEKYYLNQKLSEKVRAKITANVGNDISDEQARAIKIQYIHMSASETNAKKIKETLKEAKSIVKAGYQEFSREAKQYTIEDSIEKIIYKNAAKEKYELKAYELSNGEMSDIIQDGSEYYLLYCVDGYMKNETEANKQKLIAEKKERVLKEQYDTYRVDMDQDFNTKVWNDIKVFEN